ncbi:Aminopeptidase YwaD [Phycisphaerales bacterium]|nr:Aminopeptidase YwaD [Phycisphaerales bacterium]
MLHLLAAVVLAQPTLPAEVARAISADRAKANVEALAAFGTRHSLSDTTSPTRGIGAARNWLKSQMESYRGGLQVAFDVHQIPPMQRMPQGGEIMNVVAVLPGGMPEAAERRYYVVGHYDTINADRMDPTRDAPGANDDASGTSVVLECARALAGAKLDATVVFLCTAAEEQGLVGAKAHADAAKARGELVMGVLSNDIVGDPSVNFFSPSPAASGPRSSEQFVRLFSEGIPRNPGAEEIAEIRRLGSESDSSSRQLARFVAYVATRENMAFRPMLVFRQDRFLRGGDHSAFNEAGFTGVRFTVPAEDYTRQHADVTERDGEPYGDVPTFVSGEYIANVARLNAATLVHLANAPRPPAKARMITAQLETGTTLRWEKSPEPDTAGYEVVWRATTAPDWEEAIDVGDVTEWKTPASKDNWFFGVRAYDKDGYRSPVSFAGAAAR